MEESIRDFWKENARGNSRRAKENQQENPRGGRKGGQLDRSSLEKSDQALVTLPGGAVVMRMVMLIVELMVQLGSELERKRTEKVQRQQQAKEPPPRGVACAI